MRHKQTRGEGIVKDIKCKTRKQYSAEEKFASYWTVCVAKKALQSFVVSKGYPKAFIRNGRRVFRGRKETAKRLAGDIPRQANTTEVKDCALRRVI